MLQQLPGNAASYRCTSITSTGQQDEGDVWWICADTNTWELEVLDCILYVFRDKILWATVYPTLCLSPWSLWRLFLRSSLFGQELSCLYEVIGPLPSYISVFTVHHEHKWQNTLWTLLGTLSVQHHVYESQVWDIVLSHFQAVHTLTACFSKIQFNILPHIPMLSKHSVPLSFPNQDCTHFSFTPSMLHVTPISSYMVESHEQEVQY
jgi:hypothetical protein